MRLMPNILVACIGTTCLLGCSQRLSHLPVTPPDSTAGLFPLAAGNEWVYHYRQWIEGDLADDSYDTSRLDTSLLWNGAEWFGARGDSVFCRNESDGFYYLIFDQDHPDGYEVLIYRYPTHANETWMIQPDSMRVQVITTNASVTVPAAAFHECIQYRVFTKSNIPTDHYILPEVGEVYTALDDTSIVYEFRKVRYELVSFRSGL